MGKTIWIRYEEDSNWSLLTTEDINTLRLLGHHVIVETKDEQHSWITKAPTSCVIIGKEKISNIEIPLCHRHIYFANIKNGDSASIAILKQFVQGEGTLYDLSQIFENQETAQKQFPELLIQFLDNKIEGTLWENALGHFFELIIGFQIKKDILEEDRNNNKLM